MKIVVLGATAFIGRALVLALQGRGDTVRVLACSRARPLAGARDRRLDVSAA